MTRPARFPSPQDACSEKAFYLQEIRGRTLPLAGKAESWSAGPDPEPLLRELETNETRVLLLGTDAAWLTATSGRAPLSAASRRLSGQVWRAFASSRRFALLAEERAGFAASWREVARRLALHKVVIVDAVGGLQAAAGERINAFVAISTPQTFPLWLYWYGGLLNYLIPSGGGQFAVEAPYILPAAKALGIGPATVITFAWSDMMTDMIQPFWAIAMLAVAKLHFRDIMGWLLMVFFVYFIITSLAFLFFIPNW